MKIENVPFTGHARFLGTGHGAYMASHVARVWKATCGCRMAAGPVRPAKKGENRMIITHLCREHPRPAVL